MTERELREKMARTLYGLARNVEPIDALWATIHSMIKAEFYEKTDQILNLIKQAGFKKIENENRD